MHKLSDRFMNIWCNSILGSNGVHTHDAVQHFGCYQKGHILCGMLEEKHVIFVTRVCTEAYIVFMIVDKTVSPKGPFSSCSGAFSPIFLN